MDFHSQATVVPPCAIPDDATLDEKPWAACSLASPTECTAEDDDSSSSSSSSSSSDDDDCVGLHNASTDFICTTPFTTAGLFIQTDKPLPLNPQRTIPLPIHRLWKRCGETNKANTSAADILCKTGSATAQYSNQDSSLDGHAHRQSPRRSRSLDNGDIGTIGGSNELRGGRRAKDQLRRSQSVDDAADDEDATNYDEEWHSEGRTFSDPQRGPGLRRAQSDTETDDYIYSSMNTTSARRPFAFFRGRR